MKIKKTSSKGLGNLWRLEIERTKFVSPFADIPLLLSYFKVAGYQAPLELDTHQINSTRSAFDFRRV